MTEKEFLTEFAEDILETDYPLTLETALSDISEWDSLALVSFVAMANADGKAISKDAVGKSKIVRDLYNLIGK